MFDLLKSNTTNIIPDIHSTDSHGINAVNFIILYIFCYWFAPRYKDIRKKAATSLYGFRHPGEYDEKWLLKPAKKANEELIVDEWENIQRIMVSLDRKTASQGVIVGKLASHARRSKTKRALWELDHIIETLHILNYIDSPQYRKNIHRAVNRGESYHKLRRAVSHANFGKLRFKTEYEQEIWNESARLISNCIIFYNATIFSRLWEYRKSIGDEAGAAEILAASPVAWNDINLRGRYAFRGKSAPVDIDAIVQKLAKLPFEPGSDQEGENLD
jgi:TnpA family transposase